MARGANAAKGRMELVIVVSWYLRETSYIEFRETLCYMIVFVHNDYRGFAEENKDLMTVASQKERWCLPPIVPTEWKVPSFGRQLRLPRDPGRGKVGSFLLNNYTETTEKTISYPKPSTQ